MGRVTSNCLGNASNITFGCKQSKLTIKLKTKANANAANHPVAPPPAHYALSAAHNPSPPPTASGISFHDWVKRLYKIYQLLGNTLAQTAHVDSHYALQSHFCGLDWGIPYDYMLKLEDTNTWYADLIKDMGLTWGVSSGWPNDNTCFLSAPGMQCNGPAVEQD